MPEMSFGRSIRYRRTKLGLSQTRLGELVGRSAAAVRSWERDASTPSDPSVLRALSAVLGIEQEVLFEKAGVATPSVETSPTVEEFLGSLAPELPLEEEIPEESPEEEDSLTAEADQEDDDIEFTLTEPPPPPPEPVSTPSPLFVAPRQQFVYTMPAPPLAEPTYIEDESQRQLYRLRNLATLVGVVALIVMFVWALGNSWEAMTGWWDDFLGNLQL